MKTYSPYSTQEFRSNLIVMPAPPEPMEPPAVGIIKGLLYASPVIILFWACVFYACKELVR